MQPVEEQGRPLPRARDCGGRVDDGRVAVRGKGAKDVNGGLGPGVGRIDDAMAGLSGGDQRECGAYIVGLDNPGGDRAPEPEGLKRVLGVDPGRHGVDQRHRQASIADQRSQIEGLRDLHGGGRCVADQDQAVAKQRPPRLRLCQALGFQNVHPGGIG